MSLEKYFSTIGCKPELPAQQRCWDDCDLQWRECLRDVGCHTYPPIEDPSIKESWHSIRCTYDGRQYCWAKFQSCKVECPCGDHEIKVLGELKYTDNESLCLNGCPCPETASKKDFCIEKQHEILVLQSGRQKSLNYRHDIKSRMQRRF